MSKLTKKDIAKFKKGIGIQLITPSEKKAMSMKGLIKDIKELIKF